MQNSPSSSPEALTGNRLLLFVAGCASMLLFGVVMAVLGTLFGLPIIRQRLHLDFAQQGQLILLLYVGMLVADLLVGSLIDSFGHKWVLVCSSIIMAFSLAGFAGAGSFAGAAALTILLGLGGGGLNVSGNALVSDVFIERRSAMMNLAGAFYAVGALLVPLLIAITQGTFPVERVLLWGAGLSLVCAVLFVVLRFPSSHHKAALSLLESIKVARNPGLWVIALLLMFQAGNEAAAAGWTSSYAGAAGHSPRTATFILAAQWTALILGRMCASAFVTRIGKQRTILASAMLSIVGCLLLFAAHSAGMLALGAAVIGFSFGPIFQTGLSIAGDRYPESTGSVFGLLFAMAVPGGMAWPWATGQIAQSYSLRYGMLVPLAGAIGICLLTRALRSSVPVTAKAGAN